MDLAVLAKLFWWSLVPDVIHLIAVRKFFVRLLPQKYSIEEELRLSSDLLEKKYFDALI